MSRSDTVPCVVRDVALRSGFIAALDTEKSLVPVFVDLARIQPDGAKIVPSIHPNGDTRYSVSEMKCIENGTFILTSLGGRSLSVIPVRGKGAIRIAIAERDYLISIQEYEDAARFRDRVLKPLEELKRKSERILSSHVAVGETHVRASVQSSAPAHDSDPCLCSHPRKWHAPRPMTLGRHECLACGELCPEFSPASLPCSDAARSLMEDCMTKGLSDAKTLEAKIIAEGHKCMVCGVDAGTRIPIIKVYGGETAVLVCASCDAAKYAQDEFGTPDAPASVKVNFKREVPYRLGSPAAGQPEPPNRAPVAQTPANPMPVCAYSRPVRVGASVAVRHDDVDLQAIGCLDSSHPERNAWHASTHAAVSASMRDVVSRALRTMRSLPVCPYGERQVDVVWMWADMKRTERNDLGQHVQAALVCERCAKATKEPNS